MKPLAIAVFFILSLTISTICHGLDAKQIVEKIEDNLNGDSAEMEITMIVETRRGDRTIRMESYSVGSEKSFIKITYPGKDAGITFLKIDNSMWQYVPRIEKIIKIPASMMLQSWMGSDFTNDDLVRESSLSEDYISTLIGETQEYYSLKLQPLEEAAVVWGKIIMQVDREHFIPVSAHYYDEDDILVRILEYSEVKPLGDRHYPTLWTMTPQTEEKMGRKTTIEITRAEFNIPISSSYFTKRALKSYSR